MSWPRDAFFVVQKDSDTVVLTWREFTRDYAVAGWSVVDWFRASCRHVATVKAKARAK